MARSMALLAWIPLRLWCAAAVILRKFKKINSLRRLGSVLEIHLERSAVRLATEAQTCARVEAHVRALEGVIGRRILSRDASMLPVHLPPLYFSLPTSVVKNVLKQCPSAPWALLLSEEIEQVNPQLIESSKLVRLSMAPPSTNSGIAWMNPGPGYADLMKHSDLRALIVARLVIECEPSKVILDASDANVRLLSRYGRAMRQTSEIHQLDGFSNTK